MTSRFPQHFKSQLCLLVENVFLSDGLAFHTKLSYRLHHSSCDSCRITNSRHVTEGDGLEPIKDIDIATVGRAWYPLLDERMAFNLPVRRNCYCVCLGPGRSLDSLRCGRQLELIRCNSSKRIKEVAESHGFRGIIAGTCKTTPGIHAQLSGLNPYLQFFVKDFGMLKVRHARQWHRSTSIRPLGPMIMFKDNRIASNRR